MEYHRVLERLARDHAALAHDDPRAADARAAFEQLFDPFEPEALRRSVDETYAAEPFFNDTLKTVRNRDVLGAYLAETAEAVRDCRVAVDEWTPANVGWYVRWRMTIRFRRFKPDVDNESMGISHVVFDRDGRVALHQDFWDAAGGFYEHLPIVGGLIRKVRQRL